MKKSFIAISFSLLPVLAFSYELNFNKNFSKLVSADLLTTNITVSVEKKDENKVNIEIEKFNDFMKKYKNIDIKNGSFTLSPKYKHYENKQEFAGYIGSLRYSAESKSAKELNSFMDELISLRESIKSEDVKLNISNVSWKIGEELQNKSYDDLRLESITWIESYSKSLSNEVSKKCEVTKINISEVTDANVPYIMADVAYPSMSKRSMDVSPMNSEQNITITPNFVLDCK